MMRPLGVLLALALPLLAAPAVAASAAPPGPAAQQQVPKVAQVARIYPHLKKSEARVEVTKVHRLTDDCGKGKAYAGSRAWRASYVLTDPPPVPTGPMVSVVAMRLRSVAHATAVTQDHVDGLAACFEARNDDPDDYAYYGVEPVSFDVGEQSNGITTTTQIATKTRVGQTLAARDGRWVVLVTVEHYLAYNPVEDAVRLTRVALRRATR